MAASEEKYRAVFDGAADALFSAGNTGATVLAAYTGFGLLRGAERPALAATVPTMKGTAVLLDIGANADCRPQHLVAFAAMGAVFARVGLGIAERLARYPGGHPPRVCMEALAQTRQRASPYQR